MAGRDHIQRELHESLDRRRRPEDVARLILDGFADLYTPAEQPAIRLAARGAPRRFDYSSMCDDFARPVGMAAQLATAATLFDAVAPVPPAAHADPAVVGDYLAAAGQTIRKAVGASDFKADRVARRAAGLDLSKRQYNKRFRLLARMERKRDRLARELRKRFFTLVGKSRLASQVPWAEFIADPASACFIAYYTSRCHLRSEFTIGGQQRPYDQIADALFAAVKRSAGANWWAVAHTFPDREVLARLTDERKGRLLATWFGILAEIAGLLRTVWEANRFDRVTMIVRRGDDSSTWNGTAGAWNKAREAWIALLHALEADALLDAV